MTCTRAVGTLVLAIVIPVLLANHHQNRSDSKWKHRDHETMRPRDESLRSPIPSGDNETLAISHFVDGDGDKVPDYQVTCENARLKCAYRVGCGMALQSYMVGCSDVISGSSKRCSDHCRNALIALTSTDEGEGLMRCKCGDTYCEDAKQRITVCRNAVLSATNDSSPVSCSVAQWICSADPLCSTALEYYNRFCRAMFAGKKCTSRCKNSISILRRQEKAAKLTSCVCDGSEDYDCPSILDNMNKLCRLKPYASATTTTTSPRTATTTTQRSTTTKAPHRQEMALGGGSGVAGRRQNGTAEKNELDDQVAAAATTRPIGQLPRHPTEHEMCGEIVASINSNCTPSANEEDNEASVEINPDRVASSGSGFFVSLHLVTSSLIVTRLICSLLNSI